MTLWSRLLLNGVFGCFMRLLSVAFVWMSFILCSKATLAFVRSFSRRKMTPPPHLQRSTTTERGGVSSSLSSQQISSSSSSNNLPPLIDVDCNLWHKDLHSLQKDDDDDDTFFETLLKEDAVTESNIVAMVSPSSTVDEARRGLQLLVKYYNNYNDSSPSSKNINIRSQVNIKIRTTVGIHPYHVQDEDVLQLSLTQQVETMKELLTLDNSSRRQQRYCAAVGECGLDTSEGFPPIDAQLPYFQAQIQLAKELALPLFVHERLAFDECMACLQDVDTDSVPVIIHCFTGTVDECRAYIERGYYISLSGYIFKDEASQVRQCLEQDVIPLDRLMIETDAPYLGFMGCRDAYAQKHQDYVNSLNSKKRKRLLNSTYPNLPSSLPKVLKKVLQHINVGRTERGEELFSRDELALQTTRNANAFFQFGIEDELLEV